MFSDGIRPGGDLTELDGSDQTRIPPRRSGRTQKKVEKQPGLGYSDFLVSGLISNTNLWAIWSLLRRYLFIWFVSYFLFEIEIFLILFD